MALGVAAVLAVAGGLWSLRPAPPRRPDVFVFTVDTLRADHTSLDGYARATTPWLEELGKHGQIYEHCLASSSWTVPSLVGLHTGVDPWTLGMHRAPSLRVDGTGLAEHPVLPPDATTLAERFRAAGYTTLGLTANAHLDADLGWAQGFDHYENLGWASVDQLDDHLDPLRTGTPRFVWVHVFDPHDPYLPVPGSPWPADPKLGPLDLPLHELGERGLASVAGLVDLYDGEILDTDRFLAHAANRLGVTADDLVLFVSDHGEEFGERGHLGHRKTLYEESVRVPCVLAGPGVASGRIDRPVGLPELHDQLLHAARLAEAPSPRAPIAQLWHPGGEWWATWEGASKQIEGPEGAVRFDLATDPRETVPLAPDPALTARLDAARATASTAATTDLEVEGLSALGYVDEP